ncbi:unnamed protein product (mitochondrion) [Plasmodiophora brassicae]|uniref:BTB domain-containing protein n=1 Tax=Plasmodiophora brassicae TaxID=37360 RepID=A0A0G4IUZ9_PLABS|nr:hypothetical protein PBRA_007196 [Plasmodiophora brassicae]SPQ98633.1 unnamed protein product [Plasmodiophora brassicae]
MTEDAKTPDGTIACPGEVVLVDQAQHHCWRSSDAVVDADSSSSLSRVLQPLVNNALLSDVTFMADGQVVHAHRLVLAAWSAPFRVMFTNGWAESRMAQIEVEAADVDALKLMLEFMYTGSIHLEPHMALPVLALANRYAVVPLQRIAEQFIEQQLDVGNCCLFLSAADRFNCDRLRQICFEFTVEQFEAASSTRGFLLLSTDCMRQLLHSNDLVVCSEEVVFRALSTWLAADLASRGKQAADLLQLVRFPMMRSSFLYETVEKDPVVQGVGVMRDLLLQAYRFHAVSPLGHVPDGCQERGKEAMLFGDRVGRICASLSTPSMSGAHPIDNVRYKDDKYWLPCNSDRAEIMLDLDGLFRITRIRMQNRHSVEFQVLFKEAHEELWRELVPITQSGRHKVVSEIELNKGVVHHRTKAVARYLLIRLLGRSHSSYHTSVYWIEVHGMRAPNTTAAPSTPNHVVVPCKDDRAHDQS